VKVSTSDQTGISKLTTKLSSASPGVSSVSLVKNRLYLVTLFNVKASTSFSFTFANGATSTSLGKIASTKAGVLTLPGLQISKAGSFTVTGSIGSKAAIVLKIKVKLPRGKTPIEPARRTSAEGLPPPPTLIGPAFLGISSKITLNSRNSFLTSHVHHLANGAL